jgi:hypothetical protein
MKPTGWSTSVVSKEVGPAVRVLDSSEQHVLHDQQRHPSVGFQAGMDEGAQLVEGAVVKHAPGQVVDHGFTLGRNGHYRMPPGSGQLAGTCGKCKLTRISTLSRT